MDISQEDAKVRDFDVAEMLTNEEDIALYIVMALETGDIHRIAMSLGTVARAYGMSEIARKTGLDRSALYKTLSKDGHPQFDTILKILKIFNITLSGKHQEKNISGMSKQVYPVKLVGFSSKKVKKKPVKNSSDNKL